MNKQLIATLLFSISFPLTTFAQGQVSSKAPPLSPQDSIKTMQIQPGYRITSVLSEPHIREPAGGKQITIKKDAIDEILPSPKSAMPPGLANQLGSRQQFLDLARFVMEISQGGPKRLSELKPQGSGS